MLQGKRVFPFVSFCTANSHIFILNTVRMSWVSSQLSSWEKETHTYTQASHYDIKHFSPTQSADNQLRFSSTPLSLLTLKLSNTWQMPISSLSLSLLSIDWTSFLLQPPPPNLGSFPVSLSVSASLAFCTFTLFWLHPPFSSIFIPLTLDLSLCLVAVFSVFTSLALCICLFKMWET